MHYTFWVSWWWLSPLRLDVWALGSLQQEHWSSQGITHETNFPGYMRVRKSLFSKKNSSRIIVHCHRNAWRKGEEDTMKRLGHKSRAAWLLQKWLRTRLTGKHGVLPVHVCMRWGKYMVSLSLIKSRWANDVFGVCHLRSLWLRNMLSQFVT